MENFVQRWLHDHEWLDEDTSETKKTAIRVGVSTLGRFAHSAGETFGAGLAAASVAMNGAMQERFTLEQEPVNF